MAQKEFILTAPVLFLTFNRPEETKRVFEEIKKAKPKQLFIASDGPRESRPEEKIVITELRAHLLKNIDWRCKIKTLFRDKNFGCRKSVSGAIDWFFSHVEKGVILEDDCLPSQSFFRFCQELLERYKDDKRIMQISGTNVEGISKIEESYFFSRTYNVWGWATWRRAWEHYDVNVKLWPKFKKEGWIRNFTDNFIERKQHILGMDNLYNGKTDTWDFQWSFCCMINNGLTIIPKKNLIKNIGFFGQGTHVNPFEKKKSLNLFDLEFPLKENVFFVESKRYRVLSKKFFYQGRLRGRNKLRRLLSILRTRG